MSDQTIESDAHIVFFGMHIELYQWIAFFAGAQMVRIALESTCGSTGLGGMDVISRKDSQICIMYSPTLAYLSNLTVPILYVGYSLSLLLVVVSCASLYMIKKKFIKGVIITAYLSYALTVLSFADSLTTLIATVIARDQRVATCASLYLDTPPCPGCDTHQFCAEIITASIMWQSLGVVFNLVINLFLSLGIHQHCIQTKKVGKINNDEKPTVDFKVDLDAEGFQVVELK
ncbi:hypothetical protein K450DRAFT_195942 [Umbelopsis ramanniana AG]|uniref:Uncharacterized protein n=1 Tax=Umbelopsis ramanniana AG TaxID=1314678 RepID=A0AAD5EGZ8_UMBRA|nr:uncharacterized protein K450DRAFT_195942 [Umbelopsis ramanniana AG]KAI8583663.1 hypothetical protein K450DRAFT_195942 [Umbelopsis ramanniana AG]